MAGNKDRCNPEKLKREISAGENGNRRLLDHQAGLFSYGTCVTYV
jgi:hypothetical protein